MTSHTTLGYAYPDGTDPVSSTPDTVAELAGLVDSALGLQCADRAIFAFTAPPNVQTVAVAFPAGLFTVAADIIVTANIQSTDPSQNFSAVTLDGAPTLTGCTLKCQRNAGAAGNVTVHWHAIQIAPA